MRCPLLAQTALAELPHAARSPLGSIPTPRGLWRRPRAPGAAGFPRPRVQRGAGKEFKSLAPNDHLCVGGIRKEQSVRVISVCSIRKEQSVIQVRLFGLPWSKDPQLRPPASGGGVGAAASLSGS